MEGRDRPFFLARHLFRPRFVLLPMTASLLYVGVRFWPAPILINFRKYQLEETCLAVNVSITPRKDGGIFRGESLEYYCLLIGGYRQLRSTEF